MIDNSQAPHTFKVVHIEEGGIAILNAGTNLGVSRGQKYLVYKSGDEVFDPDTLQSLGRVELVRGYGIIVDVDTKKSYLQAVRHNGPIVGPLGGFTSSIIARLQSRNNVLQILQQRELKNDLYDIDSKKYEKVEFQGIKKGDMARFISNNS